MWMSRRKLHRQYWRFRAITAHFLQETLLCSPIIWISVSVSIHQGVHWQQGLSRPKSLCQFIATCKNFNKLLLGWLRVEFFSVWATGLKPGLSLTGLTGQTVLIYWAITGCLVFDGFGVHFIGGEKGPRFSFERARWMKNFVVFAVSLPYVLSEVERNGAKKRSDSLTKWVLFWVGSPHRDLKVYGRKKMKETRTISGSFPLSCKNLGS